MWVSNKLMILRKYWTTFNSISCLFQIWSVFQSLLKKSLPLGCRVIWLNDLYEELHSSYRKFHNTETALTCVHDDILRAIDDNKNILLIMLDLSAAFSIVDHDILLERFKSGLGICGTVLNWFKSYLSGRSQSVLTNGTQSKPTSLVCGVPQGSVSIHYLHAVVGWHNQEAWNAVSHVYGLLSIIYYFRSIWHQ